MWWGDAKIEFERVTTGHIVLMRPVHTTRDIFELRLSTVFCVFYVEKGE